MLGVLCKKNERNVSCNKEKCRPKVGVVDFSVAVTAAIDKIGFFLRRSTRNWKDLI